MSQTSVQNLGAMDIASGFAPKNGPRAVPTLIDFSVASPFNLDLTFMEQMDKLEFVQTVYIDNSANSGSVTVQSLGTQQKITCPPSAQGYFPMLVTQQPKFAITSSTGTPIVPIQFLNVAIPCMIWYSTNTNILGGVTITGTASVASAPSAIVANIPINNANFYPTTIQTRLSSAATTNATIVRATNCVLTGGMITNSGTTAAFLKFYDKASAPTVGTDTPIMTITLPASTATTVQPPVYIGSILGLVGVKFTAGLAFAITGAYADADTTAVAAGQVNVQLMSS